jgi:hypothetical protein
MVKKREKEKEVDEGEGREKDFEIVSDMNTLPPDVCRKKIPRKFQGQGLW